jgi:hypothetical protein
MRIRIRNTAAKLTKLSLMIRQKVDKASNDLREYKKYVRETGGGPGKSPPSGNFIKTRNSDMRVPEVTDVNLSRQFSYRRQDRVP